MRSDRIHFGFHFFLNVGSEKKNGSTQKRATYPFGSLEFSEFTSTVDFEACTKDLDFVSVHCYTNIRIQKRTKEKKRTCVCNQNFGIFQSFRRICRNCFIQNVTCYRNKARKVLKIDEHVPSSR